MNAEELKRRIKEILGEQVIFNKEFDELADAIKNPEDLLSWCTSIKEGKIHPVFNSKLGDKIVFIKKIGSENRCIILKIKNQGFIEAHLGDHRHYNYLTSALRIKRSSETY